MPPAGVVRRWRGGGRVAARRRSAKRRARRRDDAGRLGAHAQHAPAAGGQDLEVEIIEAADPEGLAGGSDGLLDRPSSELLVLAHRRLPRRLLRPFAGLMVPAALSVAERLGALVVACGAWLRMVAG